MDDYIVFVRTNADGIITDINSSAFVDNTTDWVQIDSGTGDKYHHAQGNYLEKSLTDNKNLYNYKLVDGKVIERSAAEKAPELQKIDDQNEIITLKQRLADTDYVAAKLAEGAATPADYADILAERAAWRSRINQLQERTV